MQKMKKMQNSYKKSGVNISLANKLIESWPNWTGKWLNIFGLTGSGKTHLSKILEKKINRLKIVNCKNVNYSLIEELNNLDCLIIDNFTNNINSGIWFLIAPEDNSTPLQTISY